MVLIGIIVSEEKVEFREENRVALHLVAWPRILAVVVIRHLITPEELCCSHHILGENIAHAQLNAATSVVDGIVGRSDAGVMAEMAVGDECAPRALVGGISSLVVQLDAP